MINNLQINILKGSEITPFIPELAKLRIRIFHDYPYLYEGDIDYEQNYLHIYTKCPDSVMVIVLDQAKVVGASTSIPLRFEHQEFQQPFLNQGKKIDDIFYLGESVLLHQYRGMNIYHKFFLARETAAKEQGYHTTAFCSVKRAPNDPRKPINYKPLDQIWERYGYSHHPELCAYYSWKEIGESKESEKPLTFWLKSL